MSPDTPTAQPDQNSLILGELRGQVRELVHCVANLSGKFDALTREVIGLSSMAGDIGALKAKVEALEAERNRSEGVKGLLHLIVKSPGVAWLAGAALAAWAWLGRGHAS